DARPGVAADQHRVALLGGVERLHVDLGPALKILHRRLRVGDMPAEMPDRALRLARRRAVDLVEQHHHVIRRKQRRVAAPMSFLCAGELPGKKIDRRLGIDRVQMEMMEAGGRKHRESSRREMLRHYALGSEEINAWSI